MIRYRVVCAALEPCPVAVGRFHVRKVGTGAALRERDWTALEVVDAIKAGETFYIHSRDRGENAIILSVICPGCQKVPTLTTEPGKDLELDVFGLPELHD